MKYANTEFLLSIKVNNLYLFTGEETYLLQETVGQWKEAFVAKHGDLNLIIIDGKKAPPAEIVSHSAALPFLAEKRLIFVENLPETAKSKASGEEEEEPEDKKKEGQGLIDFLPNLPETSVLVFVQPTPDKRKVLYKALSKLAQIKEFKPLEGATLHHWIQKRVESKNAKIETDAITHLIDLTGADLWRLSQEVDKLTTYQRNGAITRREIDKLVIPTLEANIFHLTDALGSRDHQRGIRELHRSMAAGAELRQVFYMIVRQFRLFILIRSALKNKPYATPAELASRLKLHPFVVRSTLSQTRHFEDQPLARAYEKLLEIDVALKTSQIKTTVDNQTELAMAIERFIVDFCGQ